MLIFFQLFSEIMAESTQEELMQEEFEMEGEKTSFKEHSSTIKHVADVCIRYNYRKKM